MILSKIFHFITLTSVKLHIDDSHSLLHSMNTLYYASNIFKEEVKRKPFLKSQEKIIHTSALLHDMIDRKYILPDVGMNHIKTHFKDDFTTNEMETVEQIIRTMPYSKINQDGYPKLGEYQTAFHIVREADLLCSYDFDRAISYKSFMLEKINSVSKKKVDKTYPYFEESYLDSCDFFQSRVLKYIENDVFLLDSSKQIAKGLHDQAILRMWFWKNIYDTYRIPQ